jgi:hypothetical protein
MTNWKGYGKKRSWNDLRYYTGICLEELRATTKISSDNSRCSVWDLNPRLPEYEADDTHWIAKFGGFAEENVKVVDSAGRSNCFTVTETARTLVL